MQPSNTSYRIFPLGDSAVTIDFGNVIDEMTNKEVVARLNQLQSEPFFGMTEVVPAYSSLTVYYNVVAINKKVTNSDSAFDWVKKQLIEKLNQLTEYTASVEKLIKIPVCYDDEFSPDLKYISSANKISVEEIIKIHKAKRYKVFMLGFLPGFPYLGEVDGRIAISRKAQPQNVAAGSVGIAGKQTGIYPLASPGGWQIIGRTPEKLFDTAKENPVLLKAGDTVEFYSITKDEFKNY